MLWIYINNTGVAECMVNVGNRIRQGDDFDCFFVFEGWDTGNTRWVLDAIRYLKPATTEFSGDGVGTPNPVDRKFHLNDPSKANSYFVGEQTYFGYQINIPAEATTFDANGGHIALEILLRRWDGTETHAQNISVYVEPTVGKTPNRMTAQDYSTLLTLIRQANFNYLASLSIATANGAQPIVDDTDSTPCVAVGRSLSFVKGKLILTKANIHTDYNPFLGGDDYNATDGYGVVAYLESATFELKSQTQFIGRDEDGNDIMFRLNSYQGKLALEVKIADLQAVSTVEFFGTCWIDSETLQFAEGENTALLITGAVVDGVTTLPAGSNASVEMHVDTDDNVTGVLRFTFGIPRGADGANGADGQDGVSIASVIQTQTSTESSGVNEVTVTLSNGAQSKFEVRNGEKGEPNIQNTGYTFTIEGDNLILYYSSADAPDLHIVSDDPSSPDYYVTLGVDASLINHLVYIY